MALSAQVLGDMVHDVGSGAELGKNFPVALAAVGTPLGPIGSRRGEIVRLTRHTIFVAEAFQPRLGRVQGHALQEAGQLNDALIFGS